MLFSDWEGYAVASHVYKNFNRCNDTMKCERLLFKYLDKNIDNELSADEILTGIQALKRQMAVGGIYHHELSVEKFQKFFQAIQSDIRPMIDAEDIDKSG